MRGIYDCNMEVKCSLGVICEGWQWVLVNFLRNAPSNCDAAEDLSDASSSESQYEIQSSTIEYIVF